ncbi:MAG: FAD-binding oxidoreductase [Hyphomicrobiales bacterium]
MSQKHIAIVGAGIVGISTAIWLQRAGHRVTVIDREGPAAGTSYGNAGILAAIAIVPVSVPGIWKKAPAMLLDPKQPLFIRLSHLPKMVTYLWQFLKNSRNDRVNHIASALTSMIQDSVQQHQSLANGTGAERFIEAGSYVFGYDTKASYEKDAYAWQIRREQGFEFVEMGPKEIAAYDPSLIGRFGFAVRCLNHGHITDPGAYVKALAAHMVQEGGVLQIAEVQDIECENGEARRLITTEGPIEADHVVVANGVWSGDLAKKLGVKVSLQAERGYHVEFVNPSIKLKGPTMVAAAKFAMTPMEGRLRCAGIVEYAGIDDAPSKVPIDLLMSETKRIMPELTYDRIDTWMGRRPSTVDSLPLIGPVNQTPNVWTGFGHQHIGLTAGPKTGRWLADMISGKKPNIDLSAFDANRFS